MIVKIPDNKTPRPSSSRCVIRAARMACRVGQRPESSAHKQNLGRPSFFTPPKGNPLPPRPTPLTSSHTHTLCYTHFIRTRLALSSWCGRRGGELFGQKSGRARRRRRHEPQRVTRSQRGPPRPPSQAVPCARGTRAARVCVCHPRRTGNGASNLHDSAGRTCLGSPREHGWGSWGLSPPLGVLPPPLGVWGAPPPPG